MVLPKRKHPRLKNHDYGARDIYFITICTKNRNPCLCNITAPVVGRDDLITPNDDLITPNDDLITPNLTDVGNIVDKYINRIEQSYNGVFIKIYVIMPDHIHLLIYIDNANDDAVETIAVTNTDMMKPQDSGVMTSSRPTIPIIVKGLKRMVTKEIGYSIWQESFYDKIIRDENAYRNIWHYIDGNPYKWVKNNLNGK